MTQTRTAPASIRWALATLATLAALGTASCAAGPDLAAATAAVQDRMNGLRELSVDGGWEPGPLVFEAPEACDDAPGGRKGTEQSMSFSLRVDSDSAARDFADNVTGSRLDPGFEWRSGSRLSADRAGQRFEVRLEDAQVMVVASTGCRLG